MLFKRDFYINGRWTAPLSPRDCEVIDPSTEEPCAIISLGSEADTNAAVAAAKAAFPAWAATPPAARRDVVVKILEQYELRLEELAHAIAMEMGAPIDMARDSQAPVSYTHLDVYKRQHRPRHFGLDHGSGFRPRLGRYDQRSRARD